MTKDDIGKVVICSTAYDSKVYLPYQTSLVTTLVTLEKLGIKWDQWSWTGDFHVERAVNGLMTRFLNSDYDQLLWIDTDESWRAEDVVRILSHKEEVVGGAYPMKNRWDEYVGELVWEDGHPHGKHLPDGTVLLKAELIAGGFLKTRKSALQKLAPKCDWYHYKSEYGLEKHYQFFWNEIRDHEFHGMDYVYCEKLKSVGVELWIDPMIRIDHYGIKRWAGNFDKHLRDAGKTKAAFEGIRRMSGSV